MATQIEEIAMSPSTATFQTAYPSASSENEYEYQQDIAALQAWRPQDRMEIPWRESQFFLKEDWYPGIRKYARWKSRLCEEQRDRNSHMVVKTTWDRDNEERLELRKASLERAASLETRDRECPADAQKCLHFETMLMTLENAKNYIMLADSEESYPCCPTDSWEELVEEHHQGIAQWSSQTAVSTFWDVEDELIARGEHWEDVCEEEEEDNEDDWEDTDEDVDEDEKEEEGQEIDAREQKSNKRASARQGSGLSPSAFRLPTLFF